MILRALALCFPIKRLVWIQSEYTGKVFLRQLHGNENRTWVFWYPFFPPFVQRHTFYIQYEWGNHLSERVRRWAPYLPWWKEPPPEPIIINRRAMPKEDRDGRFRSTRTVPEMWK